MSDRFTPTQTSELEEIYELTFHANYSGDEPKPEERIERFASEAEARTWAGDQSIHVVEFVKVTKLAWR